MRKPPATLNGPAVARIRGFRTAHRASACARLRPATGVANGPRLQSKEIGVAEPQNGVGPADVQKIARLARLHVEDAQLAAIADDLNGILAWIEQLGEVDVDGVAPMTSAVDMRAPMRADEVTAGGIRELVLANAPKKEDGFFVVPRSVE